MSYVELATITPRARRRRLLRKRFLRRPLAVAGLIVALPRGARRLREPDRAVQLPDDDLQRVLVHHYDKHLLGTDPLVTTSGPQIVFGARASMEAGVLSTLLALTIAVPIGLVAGYYRGWIDPVIARITDVLLAFPFLILAVGLAAILGASLRNAILALGIGAVPGLIRIARGEALALREEDYVRAAIANGAATPRSCSRAHLPNMASTLIVQATGRSRSRSSARPCSRSSGSAFQPPATSWGGAAERCSGYLTDCPPARGLPRASRS